MIRAAVRDQRAAAFSPLFLPNEACDLAFGFLPLCETRPPPPDRLAQALVTTDIDNITRQSERVAAMCSVRMDAGKAGEIAVCRLMSAFRRLPTLRSGLVA